RSSRVHRALRIPVGVEAVALEPSIHARGLLGIDPETRRGRRRRRSGALGGGRGASGGVTGLGRRGRGPLGRAGRATASRREEQEREQGRTHVTYPSRRMLGATVIIGMGGLGCPAAVGLARAGVRRLTLVDGDVVDASNLHRQPLYGPEDLGRPKV